MGISNGDNGSAKSNVVKMRGFVIPKKKIATEEGTSRSPSIDSKNFVIPKKKMVMREMRDRESLRMSPSSFSSRSNASSFSSSRGPSSSSSRSSRTSSKSRSSNSSSSSRISREDPEYKPKYRKNPLLVYAPGRNEYVSSSFIVIDHPILDDVSGHYQPWQFDRFYDNDMHDRVVDFLCKSDPSYDKSDANIQRCFMDEHDIRDVKQSTLTDFIWSNKIGSRDPVTGDVYRGTIFL